MFYKWRVNQALPFLSSSARSAGLKREEKARQRRGLRGGRQPPRGMCGGGWLCELRGTDAVVPRSRPVAAVTSTRTMTTQAREASGFRAHADPQADFSLAGIILLYSRCIPKVYSVSPTHRVVARRLFAFIQATLCFSGVSVNSVKSRA